MENEEEIKSHHIQLLAKMSKTPQHELISQMIEYYGVLGTRDLNKEQTLSFVHRVMKERIGCIENA